MSSKVAIVLIVIVLIVLGAWLVLGRSGSNQVSPTPTIQLSPSETPSVSPTASSAANATSTPKATATPTTKTSASVSVSIKNFAFNPSTITVHKGTKVTWTNNDSVGHTVTGNNGGPASQLINPGQSYSYTFNTVGSFPYHCGVHPSMLGTVQVIQ